MVGRTDGKQLRVGIVGIGWFAERYHVPNLRNTGKVEVAAICRRNHERLARAGKRLNVLQRFTDWRDMMENANIDAVVVCTAHNAHCEPTVAALEKGLHVLVEKPMALTAEEAWTMVEASKAAGKILMVGYNGRSLGVWRSVQRALACGAVGRIRQVNLVFSSDFRWLWEPEKTPPEWRERLGGSSTDGYWSEWRSDDYWRRNTTKMGGGAFADTGSHAVDLALWLSGAPPVEIFAFGESAGLPVDCFLGIQARLADGILLSLTFAAGVPGGVRSHLTVLGDRGLLHTAFRNMSEVTAEDVYLEKDGIGQKIQPVGGDQTTDEAFVETVLEGRPNPAPALCGAYAVAFTEAVYRSLRDKSPVQIDASADEGLLQ